MTSRNAVVVIAIGPSPEWVVSRPSIVAYCKKYNLALEVITEAKYGIPPFDSFSEINLFEKNQVYDLFDKYDRILRLDYDLLITPSCPNLFDIVPEGMIGGVYEDIGIIKERRKVDIMRIQAALGELDWRVGYMNVGVVVASKQHREIFNTSIEEINRVQAIPYIEMPEQAYLNYMIHKLNFNVWELYYRFNHIGYFITNRFDSHVIHYAGSKVYDPDLVVMRDELVDRKVRRTLTAEQMRRDWKVLEKMIRFIKEAADYIDNRAYGVEGDEK